MRTKWIPYCCFIAGVGLAGCNSAQPEAKTTSPEPTANQDTKPVADNNGESQTSPPKADAPKTEVKKTEEHSKLFHWASSIDEGLAMAKKSKGFVMIKFEADWCGPCQIMKKEAFTDTKVAAALSKAIIVPIDVDSPVGQTLSQKYQVSGIPRLEFLKTDGTSFGSLMGYESVDWLLGELKPILAKA